MKLDINALKEKIMEMIPFGKKEEVEEVAKKLLLKLLQ